jgi:hypothetical protein
MSWADDGIGMVVGLGAGEARRLALASPWCDTCRAFLDNRSTPTVPNVIATTATIATTCMNAE